MEALLRLMDRKSGAAHMKIRRLQQEGLDPKLVKTVQQVDGWVTSSIAQLKGFRQEMKAQTSKQMGLSAEQQDALARINEFLNVVSQALVGMEEGIVDLNAADESVSGDADERI